MTRAQSEKLKKKTRPRSQPQQMLMMNLPAMKTLNQYLIYFCKQHYAFSFSNVEVYIIKQQRHISNRL